MMKRKISWLICLVWSSALSAQEFNFETKIEVPKSSGFHKIMLSPELLGQAQLDLSDLRIYDENSVEQPYFVQRESQNFIKSSFREYEIISRQSKGDTLSYLIFINEKRDAIDNVSFLVINTDVQKRAKLSGSNDQKSWFAIKDNYLLHSMSRADKTTELKMLNFPLSDYLYFKLEIEDNATDPINILKVGYYDQQKTAGASTSFDFPIKNQKDSAKISTIVLELPELMYMENLQFELSGADYYARQARVLVREESKNAKNESVFYNRQIASLNFNSNRINQTAIDDLVTKQLIIEIENNDNRPLKLEKVTASFLNRYVIAELESGHSYVMKFGDTKLVAPKYDIANFEHQIPTDIPVLRLAEIQSLQKVATPEASKSIFENVYLIWIVIGIVGSGLAFISFRMIKELGSRS
jgi:hypothetical protein